jgi:hypothetical protein
MDRRQLEMLDPELRPFVEGLTAEEIDELAAELMRRAKALWPCDCEVPFDELPPLFDPQSPGFWN